jgi:hypothetical protein
MMTAEQLEKFRKAMEVVLMTIAHEEFPQMGMAGLVVIYDDATQWHVHSVFRSDYSMEQELDAMARVKTFVKQHRSNRLN